VLIEEHRHLDERDKRQERHEDDLRGEPDDLDRPWPKAPRLGTGRRRRAGQTIPLAERARVEWWNSHGAPYGQPPPEVAAYSRTL